MEDTVLPRRLIDHITVAAPSLAAGAEFVRRALDWLITIPAVVAHTDTPQGRRRLAAP